MQTTYLLKTIVVTFLLWFCALIAVLWIDKPLALFIHHHHWQLSFLKNFIKFFVYGLLSLVAVIIFFRYWRRGILYSIGLIIYFCITLQLSLFIKSSLKIFFGRYSPHTWLTHHFTAIHAHFPEFQWLAGNPHHSSFPSGHSTFFAFCFVWLMMLLPKFKLLFSFILILMPICLIILNSHFLGDCLSGLGLGYLLGILSIYLKNYLTKKFLPSYL